MLALIQIPIICSIYVELRLEGHRNVSEEVWVKTHTHTHTNNPPTFIIQTEVLKTFTHAGVLQPCVHTLLISCESSATEGSRAARGMSPFLFHPVLMNPHPCQVRAEAR